MAVTFCPAATQTPRATTLVVVDTARLFRLDADCGYFTRSSALSTIAGLRGSNINLEGAGAFQVKPI